MNKWRNYLVQWQRVGLPVLLGILTVTVTLFVLWSNASAGVFGSGPGGCGDFATAVTTAQDGDTIIQMVGSKDSNSAVISKNLRISGGWAPNPTCDYNTQPFTTTADIVTFGFTYYAPISRSELFAVDSVLNIEDVSDPGFPNVDTLFIEDMILSSGSSDMGGGGINGVISGSAEVLGIVFVWAIVIPAKAGIHLF